MDFEKLGVFYLGRPKVGEDKGQSAGYLLYPSKQLTTHAVCVGMTGSGKTGLCIGLLEEAAMDGVPAIIIDPKGDMVNLMLTFPDMKPEDFRPWINDDDAQKANLSPDAFAAKEAGKWRQGLADWDQDPDRIRLMRQNTEFSVYTPGSSAGLRLSILQSFNRPDEAVLNDSELLQEQVSGLASSLLSLVGIDADPIRSREHILIANLLLNSWQSGQDLDLADLIQLIQEPPIQKIGVMALEDFYSSKDRFNLALLFNNLLASPQFASWLEGEPLDISSLLYTKEGKPRLSILSIAHLSEAERMFFVSLLLNKMVAWTRSQSGTSSLRALLYMDEIFGYFPPVANPPSKAPLLTLLKQARAYGVGVVLTTQNPVDLDYKGLSNTGTWFIGRLQTERDKNRVLEGLEGAASLQGQGFKRSEMDRLISGLGKRIFLMHSVHQEETVLFETRWCMSYLCGPLTRQQIQRIEQPVAGSGDQTPNLTTEPVRPTFVAVQTAPAAQAQPDEGLPNGIRPVYGPFRGSVDGLVYKPAVIGLTQISYSDRTHNIYQTEEKMRCAPVTDGVYPVNWDEANDLDLPLDEFSAEADQEIPFSSLPVSAGDSKSYTVWKKDLLEWAYRTCRLTVPYASALKQAAQPGEDERDFRIRLQQDAREIRDEKMDQLRKKYEPKMKSIEEKIRKAEQAVDREKDEAKQSKVQTAISLGATVLSAFLGKKAVSASSLGRATTTVRSASRSVKQSGDITRSKETVEAYQAQLKELEETFEAEADALTEKMDPANQELETLVIQPYKKDIQARDLIFAWMPYRKTANGADEPAWG